VTRIGIDYTSAVRQGAGIGRYTRSLIGALAERDRENDYVLLSAGRDPSRRTWPANFRRRELPLTDRHLSIIWQRWRLPLPVELLAGRVAIYHSPDFVLPATWRARTVLTVHDLSFMRFPACSSPPLLAYLMEAVPRSVRRADLILADSENTRRDVIELLGVSPDRVHTLLLGVEDAFASQTAPEATQAALARYGIARPYILGVGTLQPRKNYPRLIRAYARLRERHGIDHQLVIAGAPGWLYEDVYATIAEHGLGEAVRITGFVAETDLPALYQAADLFAFPSLYEGFGLPILEAMACGTPVVTGNGSSLPEVAGDAALLVAPEDEDALADAIWRLLSDPSLCDTLVSRGYQRVRNFTWAKAAQQLLEAYATLAP
jgi:glycosyltransferase involved in cell wall biosynthesis